MVERLAGDFTEFVRGHQAGLLRTAYLLTGEHGTAEDLLQTALLKTYTHWTRVDEPAAYTRRVMVTTHTSWLRRRSSTERPMGDLPDRPDTTEQYDERRDDVMRALAALPARMRAAVVLRHYEDLSEAETAKIMGCSVGTVKTQTSRGLTRLRQTLPSLRPGVQAGER